MDKNRRAEDEQYNGLKEKLARLEVSTIKDFEYLLTIVNTQSESKDKALAIQAQEYTRRLTDIGIELDRLRKAQTLAVAKESYDYAHNLLVDEIKKLNAFRDNLMGKIAVTSGVIAFVVSLGVLFGRILIK